MTLLERVLSGAAAVAAVITFSYFLWDRYSADRGEATPSNGVEASSGPVQSEPSEASSAALTARIQSCQNVIAASEAMVLSCQTYVAGAVTDLNVRKLPSTSQDTRIAFQLCVDDTNAFFEVGRRETATLPQDLSDAVDALMGSGQRMGQSIVFSQENTMASSFEAARTEHRTLEHELRQACRSAAEGE